MAAISLKLPDNLAQESKTVSEKMGITRTELIRQALRHEIDRIEADIERASMAEALKTMSDDAFYIQESEALSDGLSELLPQEPDNWWQA